MINTTLAHYGSNAGKVIPIPVRHDLESILLAYIGSNAGAREPASRPIAHLILPGFWPPPIFLTKMSPLSTCNVS